jgi:hypothetical protein
VVAVGNRYHELLYAGTWLQATGALLAVIFFLALADLAGGTRPLAAKSRNWARPCCWPRRCSRSPGLVPQSMARQLAPAPASIRCPPSSASSPWFPHQRSTCRPASSSWAHRYYLARSPRSRWLWAAFAVTGLVGIFLPGAAAATAGLSGLQVLWIIAAAIALPTRNCAPQPPALPPDLLLAQMFQL